MIADSTWRCWKRRLRKMTRDLRAFHQSCRALLIILLSPTIADSMWRPNTRALATRLSSWRARLQRQRELLRNLTPSVRRLFANWYLESTTRTEQRREQPGAMLRLPCWSPSWVG